MLHSSDLRRERDFVHSNLEHVAQMLDGVGANKVGYTTAVVTMHCNAAENALEAALASVRKIKSEARLVTYQREQANPAFADDRRVPPPRGSNLPATVSPALAG